MYGNYSDKSNLYNKKDTDLNMNLMKPIACLIAKAHDNVYSIYEDIRLDNK